MLKLKVFSTGGYIARTCLATSRDGIHWSEPVAVSATKIGDRTTTVFGIDRYADISLPCQRQPSYHRADSSAAVVRSQL